jgi:hypothetical protein
VQTRISPSPLICQGGLCYPELLKAVIVRRTGELPPRVHNTRGLAEEVLDKTEQSCWVGVDFVFPRGRCIPYNGVRNLVDS